MTDAASCAYHFCEKPQIAIGLCRSHYAMQYRKKNLKKYAQRTAEWRDRNPGSVRDKMLRHRYGITSADFDRMLASQGGACITCRSTERLCVDHDHGNGRVRGILCLLCNMNLKRGVTPQILRAQADSLEDGVDITILGENRQPDDARRQVRDAERNCPRVQEHT